MKKRVFIKLSNVWKGLKPRNHFYPMDTKCLLGIEFQVKKNDSDSDGYLRNRINRGI